MNKLLNSQAARVIAFVLLLVYVVVFALSFVAVVALMSGEAYQLDSGGLSGDIYWGWCYNQAENTLAKFAIEKSTDKIETDSAFVYVITDKDGNEVHNTVNGRKTQTEVNSQSIEFLEEHTYSDSDSDMEHGVIVYRGDDGYGYTWAGRSKSGQESSIASDNTAEETAETDETAEATETAGAPKTADDDKKAAADDEQAAPVEDGSADYIAERAPYSLKGYVLAEIPRDSEIYVASRLMDVANNHRYDLLIAAVGTGLAIIALFVFLMAAVGRRKPDGAVTPTWVERIPFDIYTVAMLVLGAGCLGIMVTIVENWRMDAALVVLMGVTLVALVAVVVLWCMSFALRLKQKTVIRSCLCWRVIAWCWRVVKKLLAWCKKALCALFADVKMLPLLPRVILITFVILAVEFLYIINAQDTGAQLFGWFVERAVIIVLGVYVAAAIKRLLKAGDEIANGNMQHRVDTTRMRGALKQHGENLNQITDGMNKAIAERVKSERFKTELITNVSHDIKTPLTSIVNYVDLMEKEQIDNEKVQEYLKVLSRQSARLKKLIEDLIEASKASTGNLAVKPERCELGVMLAQTAGEYQDKLNAAGLELIIDKPEENVFIMADRQQLWRVFDNLMNNICKYSLAGTRVYLKLQRDTRMNGDALHPGAVVTFRNISKMRLNVNEDELLERFVRGDSSRNTEGSGLGLSIANSLTELQNGKMTLVVDGDLFKVQLSFDTVE